jgi:arabinofuranan 3-O-arabinosyltransferase
MRQYVAQITLVVLAVLTVSAWGPPSALLASGDIFPTTQLNPSKWLPAGLRVWNTAFTGGGDLHYGSGLALLSAEAWLPRQLGVSAALVQRAELAVLLAVTLVSMYALIPELGISTQPLPRTLGSIAYAYSLGLIVGIPNTLDFVAFCLPVLLPLLYVRVLHARGAQTTRRIAVLAIASQLLAIAFNNPPLALVSVLQSALVATVLLIRYQRRPHVVFRTVVALVAVAALSTWWLIPAYVTSFNASVQITTATNVTSWSWTHVRASLLNVWRFTASWAWRLPSVFPWSAFYNPRWLQILLLWPLGVVMVSMLVAFRRRRGDLLVWVSVAILTAWLMKGLHPPLSATNLWLYQHVPGFFLFREPSNKFSQFLAFSCALLLVTVVTSPNERRVRVLSLMAGFVLVATLAVPAITGSVTADDPVRLAPVRVTIPSDWWRMATYINGLPTNGGVALLPDDDYYQMPYRWGFYGDDLLGEELFDRPVFYLYDTPQGYSSAAGSLGDLDAQLIQQLKKNDDSALAPTLGAQNVRYVLLRRDVKSVMQGRQYVPPERLAVLLAANPDMRLVRTIGSLDLYEITSALVHAGIYAVAPEQTVPVPAAAISDVATASRHEMVTVNTSNGACTSPAVSAPGTANVHVALRARHWDGYTLEITGARGPVLLVLNQSNNSGWVAAVQSGVVSGCPISHVVVDGFANGWWIDAPGPTTIRLTFVPQRLADDAALLSLVTLILCAAFATTPLVVEVLRRARGAPRRVDSNVTPSCCLARADAGAESRDRGSQNVAPDD